MLCKGNKFSGRHRWSSAYRNDAGQIEEVCGSCDAKRIGSAVPKHEREWLEGREKGTFFSKWERVIKGTKL